MNNFLVFSVSVGSFLAAQAFSADYKNDLKACVSCRLANVQCNSASEGQECVRCRKNFYTCIVGLTTSKKETDFIACNNCRMKHRACDANNVCARCIKNCIPCVRTPFSVPAYQNSTEIILERPKKRIRLEQGTNSVMLSTGTSTLETADIPVSPEDFEFEPLAHDGRYY